MLLENRTWRMRWKGTLFEFDALPGNKPQPSEDDSSLFVLRSQIEPTDVHLFWGVAVDIPFYVLSLSIYNMGHRNIYVYIFETIIYHMHWSPQL